MEKAQNADSMSGLGGLTDGEGMADGSTKGENPRPDKPARHARGRPSGALVAALALSVCGHAILLIAWHAGPQRQQAPPSLLLPMRASIVTPAPPAPVAVPPGRPPAEAGVSADAGKPSPQPPPAQAQADPPAREAPGARRYRESTALTAPPSPRWDPAGLEARPHLVGRRLPVTLWIAEDGSVTGVDVAPLEISADMAAQLADLLRGMRFAPGRLDGRASAAVLRTRLCFDDDGRPDTSSEECLGGGSAQAR